MGGFASDTRVEQLIAPPPFASLYHDDGDMTRGVSLPAADAPLLAKDPSTSMEGDFYVEPDIVRGVTMDHPEDLRSGFVSENASCETLGFSGSGCTMFSPQNQQFLDSDVAPPAPMDPFFCFAESTLFVFCDMHGSLMNFLLEFFATQVLASVAKVSQKKMCIKVDVFVANAMCTLKARAYYQQEFGRLVLEFQKRSGDALLFAEIYKQALKYLQLKCSQAGFSIMSTLPKDSANLQHMLTLPPRPKGTLAIPDISPLLELAKQTNSLTLQAESASALASLAADPEVADALATDSDVVGGIAQLLVPDCLAVALPTASLVFHLAQRFKATEHIAIHGMSPTLWQKLERWESCLDAKGAGLARQQCAETLAATALMLQVSAAGTDGRPTCG